MACKCSDFELPKKIILNENIESNSTSLLVRPGIILFQLDLLSKKKISIPLAVDEDSYYIGMIKDGSINVVINNSKNYLLNEYEWVYFKAKNLKFKIDENDRKNLFLLCIDKDTMKSFIKLNNDELNINNYNFLFDNKGLTTEKSSKYLLSLANQIDSSRADHLIGRLELERDVIEWMILFFSMPEFKITNDKNKSFTKRDIEKFYEIAAYLDVNFCEDISLKKIALNFGISESKLKTTFKKIFSRTIFEYIRDLRFKYAEKLIKDNELSILEIAYEVGYSNPSHFSQAFKDRYGVLPKAYQMQYC